MDIEPKIKTEAPPMADPSLTLSPMHGIEDDTAELLARYAANRLEHERLKKEVQRAKEAKKAALRLKLEKEALEDKRIQEEIERMKAELEELNQPSPENTNLQPTEANGHRSEQDEAQVTNGQGKATANGTREEGDSRRINGLSEDVENLITQEAGKGQSPTLARSEATRIQENGASETRSTTKRELAAPDEVPRSESLFVDNAYDSNDEVLRRHLTASIDGSGRDRLADYLKECEKFFEAKPAWPAKKRIEFAALHLVSGLLTSWRESAIKLKNPTWEGYKVALYKANTQLESPQTHRCEKCRAGFGSEEALSQHLVQSRPCKPLVSPHSPTARKTTRPPASTEVTHNGTNGSESKASPRRRSISCAQCKLMFPSPLDLGRHRDATGHTIISPVYPKAALIRAPTGPRNPETKSTLPSLPNPSTNACQVCKISFKNHNDLVQHLHNSGHMAAKEFDKPPISNLMGAPVHSNSISKRPSYPDAAPTNGRGSPMPDSRDSRELDRRTCRSCNAAFLSRVEMHEHLRESGHAVPTFPPKHQRIHPSPYPEQSLSLHQRTSSGGGYANAQHHSSSQDEDYIGLGPSSDSPQRSRSSYKDPQRTCEKCDTEFPSRIEMFEHIREANHVMPRKRVWPGRYEDDGGLGGRVSAVRRRTDY